MSALADEVPANVSTVAAVDGSNDNLYGEPSMTLLPKLGGLLPFVAFPLSDSETSALNAYRMEYASYRLGASKGAKGEVTAAHQTDRYLVTLAMEKQYAADWATAAQAQESEDQQLLLQPLRNGTAVDSAPEVKPLVLVLGSSVSMGVGASSLQNSWAGKLGSALGERGVALRNEGVAGKESFYTLGRFQALPVRGSHGPSLIIVSLSLNNEGLKELKGVADLPIARFVTKRFLQGIRAIANHAESFGSKVLLCFIACHRFVQYESQEAYQGRP